MPGTSGLSIRSFTAGVAGDTSASAPILACVWSFSAGAPSEAISPDAPDGCGSRTSSPEVHPPARGNPGATPALSPTEARARSRRLARGFLTPDPIKRRATLKTWSEQLTKTGILCIEYSEQQSIPGGNVNDPLDATLDEIANLIEEIGMVISNRITRHVKASGTVLACKKG